MAQDAFNREIDYLRVSVTDQCNMGCIYCVPRERPRRFAAADIMTIGELLRIVGVARLFGVRKVRLTGGEPLLRPDILDIVAGIKALGMPELSLTTNGAFLGKMAARLKSAGLNRINVSLDSLKQERYRRITDGGDLDSVRAGIESARAAGIDPIKINMVPIRGINDDEIAAFARMSLAEPVHVRFIEFMPTGRDNLWSDERCIKVQEMMRIVSSEVGPLVRREFRGAGPSRNYTIEGAKGIVGFISPVSHSFCYSCNRMRINAAGRARPCLFSRTEIDLLGPMRSGADDGEIKRLFGLAISSKPEGNYLHLNPADATPGPMSSIGG